MLDELIIPMRRMKFAEEELVCLMAIIALDPGKTIRKFFTIFHEFFAIKLLVRLDRRSDEKFLRELALKNNGVN